MRRLLVAAALAVSVLASPTAATVSAAAPCAQYASLFRANGLPVATFEHIAYRESRCNARSFVNDHDDLGGGLLGINMRTAGLRATWRRWCGGTVSNVTNAAVNVRCAAAAYRRMGLRPWR